MTQRPNIMLLVAEDTGRHQGCYGEAVARTPAIDGLAAQGARFTHAFSTAPVCAPSRSALVTGRHAFAIGSHHMRSQLLDPPRLVTQELRDAGYYVNWSNKTDFNFTPPEDFADDQHDWFDDLAAGKLNDRPFFLYHNLGITHESNMWVATWQQWVRPALEPEERCDPASVTVPPHLPDLPEVRANIARYFDSLTLQDRTVARALEALEQSGQADNTLVIYLSDHGRGLPREKRWCHDGGIHLPLILRWPGVIEPGTVREDLASWVDLAPTILAAAGLPVAEELPGRIIAGPGAQEEPPYVLAGRDRMDEAFDRVRVLRDRRWHYIRNDFPQLPYSQRIRYMENIETMAALREGRACGTLPPAAEAFMSETKPPEELYDCEADPDQVRNLAGDPAHAERLRTMREALASRLEEVGDLGEVSEKALIEAGKVADVLDDYYGRVGSLPERYRLGPERTIVEMEHVPGLTAPADPGG